MPSSRFENGALLQWRLRLGVRLGITLSISDQEWTRPTDRIAYRNVSLVTARHGRGRNPIRKMLNLL